jgi:hypothetical protein
MILRKLGRSEDYLCRYLGNIDMFSLRMFLWPIMEEHRSFCRCVYLDIFISSVSYLFLCCVTT